MNKQELKEQVKEYLSFEGEQAARAALKSVLGYIEELDELEITEEQAWRLIAEKHNQNEDLWEDAKNHYLNSL